MPLFFIIFPASISTTSTLPAADGYTILLTNTLNSSDVYATSQPFKIAQQGSTYPTASPLSGPVSTSSGGASATGAASVSGSSVSTSASASASSVKSAAGMKLGNGVEMWSLMGGVGLVGVMVGLGMD